MGIYQDLWGFTGIYVDFWRFMGIYGDLWGFMGIHGDLWGFIEIFGEKTLECFEKMALLTKEQVALKKLRTEGSEMAFEDI